MALGLVSVKRPERANIVAEVAWHAVFWVRTTIGTHEEGQLVSIYIYYAV
jgi:hypothetical protein